MARAGPGMRPEVLILTLIVGVFTWAFRFFPLRTDLSDLNPDGPLARFLAATGPAAIVALFVFEVMPLLQAPLASQAPLLAGTASVFVVYAWRKSVVMATLAGSAAFGLTFALT